MAPRITLNLTADGELEIWLNAEGSFGQKTTRAVREKRPFHLGPSPNGEIEVSSRTYRSDDKLLDYGKVLFRADAWDVEHYPHVMGQSTR
jgi:hypothetical protein